MKKLIHHSFLLPINNKIILMAFRTVSLRDTTYKSIKEMAQNENRTISNFIETRLLK